MTISVLDYDDRAHRIASTLMAIRGTYVYAWWDHDSATFRCRWREQELAPQPDGGTVTEAYERIVDAWSNELLKRIEDARPAP